jgi:hypothetical protein
MKKSVIAFVTLAMISTISIGDINNVYAQVAGSVNLGGSSGSTSKGGSSGAGVGGKSTTGGTTGIAGAPNGGMSGMSGASGFAGSTGGALVVRRRYAGVHVQGTSWLASWLPLAGLFSLGWLCINLIRSQPKYSQNIHV